MKRFYLFFSILILIYGYFLTAENTIAYAKVSKHAIKTSKDISPELQVKIDEWMKLLYSEDAAIRSSATISLLGLNLPSVYDSLIDILKNSENDDVRISLIKVFGFAGDDKALNCMIELLTSEKENVRIATADALGKIKTKKAIEKMIGVLLNDQNPTSSRILIASALAKTRSREAVEPLISLLDSDNIGLQTAAREALVEITKQSDGNNKAFWQEWWDRNKVKTREQWLEDIVDNLEGEVEKLKVQNNKLRNEIVQNTIKILKVRKDKDDIRQLLDAINSEYLEVRIFAAKELANYNSPEVIKTFIDLISDDNKELRALAAKIIGEIGDASGLKFLKLALQDKEASVRESAARALGKLGKKEAVVDLLSALNDTENSVICVAAETLGAIKANEAVEPLINLLSNEDPKVKESVIVALGKIQDKKAIDPLISALKDKEERVRWYAADSLGKIGVKKAIPPLIELLSDESARVRESAATALGQVGDESVVEHLVELLKDRDNRVAEKAADVLLSIKYKNFEVIDNIANTFYAEKDYKRAIEILKKQINGFKDLPKYNQNLWQSKLKLAKLYYLTNNWKDAILLYEELVQHFENEIEIKHELVHCLKETKQNDKLLNFLLSWVTNLKTDNRLWWQGIYEIVEELFKKGEFDRVKELVDDLEKKNKYLGGSELKSKFHDLREQSLEMM